MRPLELRLAHFGPYRGQIVLDFTKLDRLFLVCGPTGAGKTTLFDALTFALYERTPGTRGGLTDQLVSHHAPEGSVPSVGLTFALGPRLWRITRVLRHRVPRLRGEGWRDQDAQVLFEEKKGEVWEPVPGKRTEINDRIAAMIGLSAEEFAKIVVLPQGDFQRFLEASSNDREKMLQKLFPVEAYERLVEGIKDRARLVEDARRRWEDRWEELTALTDPGGQDTRPELEAAWAQAAALARQAAGTEAEASAEVVRLEGLQEGWKALQAKLAERRGLEARREGIEAQRDRAERARKAGPLGTDLDRQTRILADGTSLRAVQDEARKSLEAVEANLKRLASDAADTQDREDRWAQVQKELGGLEQQKLRWAEVQNLDRGEAQAREGETRAQEALTQASSARTRAEQALPMPPPGPGWEQALPQLEATGAELRRVEALVEAHHQRLALDQALAESRGLEAKAVEAESRARAEEALWVQVTEALKAAALAHHLVPGEPCPVCGATDHPSPASWPEASAEAPTRLEAARRTLASRQAEVAQARGRVQGLETQLHALGPGSHPVPDHQAALGAHNAAQAQVEALQRWTRESTVAQQALVALQSEESRAREAWQEAVRVRDSWAHRRQALAGEAPEDPAPRMARLSAEAATLRTRLDTERKQAETWGRERETLRTRIEGLETQLTTQRDEYRRLQGTLEAATAELGWSLEDLRSARLDDRERRACEEAVAAFDREDHGLAGQIAALEARVPGGEPPALGPAQGRWEEAKAARQAREAEAKEREFALRERDRIDEELREVGRQMATLEADFQRLVPLARALDGRNPRNLKLTTWVLVQALEQVAASATHRLAILSGGRYALKVQTEGQDARKDWGLDLAVVDGYTGQERAVGTLSGGEKFMTSISLALGLADVIQERSGGLKLEVLFIDEGFGTLDDQSLDRAMAILHDLGQHRSVGIISHVAELRQRISSQVEVVKGRDGSQLRIL
jgi:exonuclease SbcC